MSGWLITRSARHTTPGRFAWHCALCILPGLWVLLVTAFVVAPLVALREHGDPAGFRAGPHGPVQYVWGNWFVGVRQYGIHDLFTVTTPWGRHTGNSIMDGALWSPVYEVACYAFTGLLAATTVLRRRGWMVLLLVCGLYPVVVADRVRGWTLDGPPATHCGSVSLPLLGGVYGQWAIYLGLLFGLGALAELYGDRIPVRDSLGLACLAVLTGSLLALGFFVVGFPALAYVLVWLSVRMSRQLRGIGRRNDYSYGIYIYGFLVQQVLAGLGWNRWASGRTRPCPWSRHACWGGCPGTWWSDVPCAGSTGRRSGDEPSRTRPGGAPTRPSGARASGDGRDAAMSRPSLRPARWLTAPASAGPGAGVGR